MLRCLINYHHFCNYLFLFVFKRKSDKNTKNINYRSFHWKLVCNQTIFNLLNNVDSIIGVLGALGAGIAYTCVRKLGKQGVNGAKIVFFFSCFSCLSVLPYLIINYQPMSLEQFLILLGAGLMAAGGQFAITAAYNNAAGKDISIYDYSQILFAAILGFIFLNQIPDIWSIVGYIIIIGAALGVYLYQRRIAN